MGARTVDKKHVRMICTVGTSLGYRCNDGKSLLQDDKNNKKLLQESEQGRDSPLCELMRTGATGILPRLKTIELLESQALPQTFDNFKFPTAGGHPPHQDRGCRPRSISQLRRRALSRIRPSTGAGGTGAAGLLRLRGLQVHRRLRGDVRADTLHPLPIHL